MRSDRKSDRVRGSRSVFVGRKGERQDLLRGLDDLSAGRGCLFLVAGEPGIGKTRLADELATEASSRGIRAIWGRCWEGGGAPAFWPWVQILRTCAERAAPSLLSLAGAGLGALARFVPEIAGGMTYEDPVDAASDRTTALALAASDPKIERFRVFDAAATFLKKAAAAEPLLLILDDCHVADFASLLFLRFLARDLHHARIMMIVTYRETELKKTPALAELIADIHRDGPKLELRGITEGETEEFVESYSGRHPDPVMVADLHRVTGGNPFFLSEIVRLWVAEGPGSRSKNARFARFKIPDEVRIAIRRSLGLVSEPTREVLNVVSVIGREFDFDIVSRVSRMSTDQLLEAFEEALKSGLIEQMFSVRGRYRFKHALFPETLYDDLPSSRRLELHGQIAEAIEDLHGSDLEPDLPLLAHHYLRTLPAQNSEKAIEYASRAADRAVGIMAYEEAARLYEMAIQACESSAPTNQSKLCELLLLQGDSLYRAGLADESRTAFQEAAKMARSLGRSTDLARAALGMGVLPSDPGIVDYEQVKLAEEALNALGESDGKLRAMLLARLARELYYSDALERRDILSRTAVDIARHGEDKATLIYVLINRHVATWGPDNLEERLDISSEILRLCDEPRTKLWKPQGLYLKIVDFLEQGNVDEADACIQELSDSSDKTWQPLAFRERALATRALMNGQFEDAERFARQALGLGRGVEHRAENAFMLLMSSLRREQGRFAEMETSLLESISTSPPRFFDRYFLALCYCENGCEAEAQAPFEVAVEPLLVSRLHTATWLAGLVIVAEICASLGDTERAPRLYDLLRPYGSRNPVLDLNSCCGSVDRYLGLLTTVMGHFDAAETHFNRALSFNREMKAYPFVVRTQYNYASMLVARGSASDRRRAAELAKAAFKTASALGMADLADRTRELKAKAESREADLADKGSGRTGRVLATVMFLDIVDSTARAAEAGDSRWGELMHRYYAAVRRGLKNFDGHEVNTFGDDFFAWFDAPAAAVRCACALRDAMFELGLKIRVGVHTGECEIEGDEMHGIAVHIGARVVREAQPGEVMVSSTVRELAVGAGLKFSDRGVKILKGVPDGWRLFVVEPG